MIHQPDSPAAPKPAPVSSSLAPIRKQDFGFDEARHLLWRAGFGGTPAQIQLLASWGPEKSVDYLIKFDKVPSDPGTEGFSKDIKRQPTPEERAEQRKAALERDENKLAEIRLKVQKAEQEDREQMHKMQNWWLKRMIETPRPLEERMALFWHGHFATSYRTIEDSWHMFAQSQMFRQHAVGSFSDLLHGIIRDPAMIKYLNNDASRKGKPNENLARELMELFSLGVGAYTEKDIKEGARALTGYNFRDDAFVFEKNNHDDGSKTILGRTGKFNGEDFVKIILEQPACAKFMATKFYRFFVADYPTGRPKVDAAAQSVIRELASTFRDSKYDIGATLRRLFLSQHFYDAAVRNEQIKSPVQLVVGAVRSLNCPARSLSDLNKSMDAMGQDIYYPPSVKGWDGGRGWINSATMFIRQNVMVYLLTGRKPGGKDALAEQEKFDAETLVKQLADVYPEVSSGTPEVIIDAFLRYAVGQTSPAGRDTLVRYVATRGGKLDGKVLTELMLLVTAMPEYQLC